MRKASVYILLGVISTAIFMLFWYNEWIYSLPTPVPENYAAVHSGEQIDLSSKLHFNNQKPVLLHFFNPDCPCSRFNLTHFRSLVKEFEGEVNFAVVVMSNKQYSKQQITDKLKVNIPVFMDTSLATLCGVYSTPQAVIIDPMQKLYFRGNYNKSRYCTDKNSNYAQIALEALVGRNNNQIISNAAFQAYGCQLPHCTNNAKKL